VSASCDDVRERAFLGRSTADDDAHLATCEACGFEAAALGSLATAFAAHRVAAPSPELETRVLGAATASRRGAPRGAARSRPPSPRRSCRCRSS
jgi:hypothetical protein